MSAPTRVALLVSSVLLALAAPALAQGEPLPAGHVERLQLKRTTAGEAFRLLAEVGGLNLVVTPEAAKVEVPSLLLTNLPVARALETLCKTYGLWYQTERGVVRVLTAKEYQSDLRVVREPKTKVFSLLHPNPISVAGAIRDLYGARVQLSYGVDEKELFGQNDGLGSFGSGAGTSLRGSSQSTFSNRSGGGVTNRFFGGGLTSNSGGGGQGFGGGQGGGQARAVKPDASERVTKTELSARQLARVKTNAGGQVVADAQGLSDLTEGRPPIAVTVNRRHNLIVVRTSDEQALKQIERLVGQLDRPTPQVLLEVKILEIRLADGFRSVLDIDLVAGPTQQNLPTGRPANPLVPTAASVAQQVGVAGSGPLIGGALVYQFINEHVRVRLQMLDNTDRLATLATPLLLCANDETARIFVGEERPLVRNFELQTTTTNGVVTNQVVPTVDLRDIGNTLRIRPRINADRTVTLTIVQDVSTVNTGGAQLPVPNGSGGIGTFAVDTVSTANLEGTVIAKDGLTLAVGGLIRKEHVDRQEGIPYLMDLPLIGWMFGETVRGTERRELILLITPHVLLTPAEGKARTEARLKALSLHPWVDHGDKALNRYTLSDVPGAADYHLLVEDYLTTASEPLRGNE